MILSRFSLSEPLAFGVDLIESCSNALGIFFFTVPDVHPFIRSSSYWLTWVYCCAFYMSLVRGKAVSVEMTMLEEVILLLQLPSLLDSVRDLGSNIPLERQEMQEAKSEKEPELMVVIWERACTQKG